MATKNRIFLAHASEDKPRVRELYNRLKAKGFSPWLDEVDLIGGQNWPGEIPKAIKEAAVCLACLSTTSVAKRSYVQKEFRYAMSALAELPPDSIYLIPVRLDDCEVPDLELSALGLKLPDLHWIDLFADDGFRKLVGAIETAVPGKRVLADFDRFRDIDAPWCPEMIMIPAGRFLMGSPESDNGRFDDEGPQHAVVISEDFALGRHPVTFEEYDAFCEETDRNKPDDQGWGRERLPVVNISYEDAKTYCLWLSNVTEMHYCLPTEAMWEYACRACSDTLYAWGNEITIEQANFDNRVGHTTIVGSYPANAWGLQDMHGNVWEWCSDRRRIYTKHSVTDPRRPADGTGSLMRGGAWNVSARYVRSAFRLANQPGNQSNSIGFRCAQVSI